MTVGTVRGQLRALLPANGQELGGDLVAAMAVTAVAIPEQIATARLAGMPATAGLLAFVLASLGFYLFGSNRFASVGADSTIAPIFAASVALLAASGSPHYMSLCLTLALLVGLIVIASGIFRMGWIARLLSVPVLTGFLAGIAVHIVVSQLPSFLGVARGQGEFFSTLASLVASLPHANPLTVIIGASVFAITFACEKIDVRIPGALIATVAASLAAWAWGGIATIGSVPPPAFAATLPDFSYPELVGLLPLALIVSLVVMIQTAATSRSFPGSGDEGAINRDLLGVGCSNILNGLFGGFPVNTSPPRTAIACESGARSRFAGLCAAMAVVIFLAFGLDLIAMVPLAALAGLLMFVAQRIFRFQVMRTVARRSRAEFVLLFITAAAIVTLPIAIGVGIGIGLSLLHGVWTITQTRAIPFEQVPGTTIWWPARAQTGGASRAGIVVIGFQAPLFFLNADVFRRTAQDIVTAAAQPVRAVILEASNIVEIDFTGAEALAATVRFCNARGIAFYIARLESLRAEQALENFGILPLLAATQTFQSVDEAVRKIGA
jgi:sulfate permease, SulP family